MLHAFELETRETPAARMPPCSPLRGDPRGWDPERPAFVDLRVQRARARRNNYLVAFSPLSVVRQSLESLRGTKFDPNMKNKKLLCNEVIMLIEVFVYG